MNFYKEIITNINDFKSAYDIKFEIDTIVIDFSKQYKLEKLEKLGEWHKIKESAMFYKKIEEKQKTHKSEKNKGKKITSAFQLKNKENKDYPIYYVNYYDYPRYYKAQLVMYGLHQYHKSEPPNNLKEQIIKILKNISSIDICFDFPEKPKIWALERDFKVNKYRNTKTYYINNANHPMIKKICIYDKNDKDKLKFPAYRLEATIIIPDTKYLNLPLYEVNKVLKLIR